MLKRLYVDNYRCLVNFELRLQQQQLVLGANGSGKTTALDALRSIRDLVGGDAHPQDLFPESSRTRWQTLSQQTVEVDADVGGVPYSFRLRLEPWGSPPKTRIRQETVLCDGRPVFEFEDGEVRLFNDSFVQKVIYPFDWFRSALATIQRRNENTRLMKFKDWLSNLHCLHLDPYRMRASTDSEDPRPANDLSNFASWYRHLSQEQGDRAAALQTSLSSVIADFQSLDLRAAGGNVRMLHARFGGEQGRKGYAVSFEELSEGQRVLVCLYAILEFLVHDSVCLFLDEPENFISLPEIQPWLMSLRDRIEERGGQVTLVSHHPELIDYLAPEMGITLERVGSGPTRIRPREDSRDSGLRYSEQIARGWTE